MGNPDTVALNFMRNPIHFADVFNFQLFRGKQIINPENLKAVDPVLLTVKPDNIVKKSDSIKKERDLLKECAIFEDGQCTYLFLGIENQEYVDWLMPFRILLYDALVYQEQIQIAREAQKNTPKEDSSEFLTGISKKTRFRPVVTLVCNFSCEPWDGPTHIHELLDVNSQEILRYVPDYRFHLFDPHTLSKSKIKRLHSQLKPVAQCLRASHNKHDLKALFQKDPAFKSLELTTVQLINSLLHLKLEPKTNSMEKVNMCQAWEEIKNDLREEGRKEGREEGRKEGEEEVIYKMLSKGRYSDDELIDVFDITVEKLKEYKVRYQKAKGTVMAS